MKRLFPFVFPLLLIFLGCGSDDSESGPENNDDGPDGAQTFELVRAFPQISFDQPLDLQSPDDDSNRLFVVEKGGRILTFQNEGDVTETTVFLDLDGNLSTTSEQGLLGLAFHPDFSSNGFFYVYYNPNESVSHVSRFTANGSTADANSELVILEIPQPFTNHNGGQLAFGADGFLYISVGDGGSGGDPQNNAQDRSNLLGNILRIDVDNPSNGLNYGVPSDNPFIGQSNVREEIYAYGLRNPWRMSFDTETNALWTGDVGQNEIEEIDIIISGGNYGWKLFEGTSCFSGDCDDAGLIAPIFEYAQSNGDRSVTGGYVYRGALLNDLKGRYIYGDFVSGRIWALAVDGSDNELLFSSELRIASFGTDANQELYLCAFDGFIYKIRVVN